MTTKTIAGWQIEYDNEATRAAYAAQPDGTGCDCSTCLNFERAAPNLSKEVFSFFEELGIDFLKPPEIYELEYKEGRVQYGGFYYIVGNYLSGDDIWQPKLMTKYQTPMFHVAGDFEIGFTQSPSMMHDFPEPVLQMEVSFTLPWVLEEPYNDKPATKKELREMDAKKYRQQLLEKLKDVIDISKIDPDADCWDIDKMNHLFVEVDYCGSIVYFSDEHQHFWEHDNSDDYDFVIETADFIKELLAGQTRFERTYRGEKLVRIAYYTKANGSDEWELQANILTAIFRPLFRFPKKIVKTEIIEFRQQ